MKHISTHFVLAAITILSLQHAAEAQVMRLSFKRVWGGPAGSSTQPAPATDWGGQAGFQLITQMVADANTILAANHTPGTPTISLDPGFEVLDLLDPGYPYSFYDVDVASNQAKKHSREAACEIDPARYLYRPDAINIYLVNSITQPGLVPPQLSGISSFPPGVLNGPIFNDENDLIFISDTPSAHALNQGYQFFYSATLAHEVGHYFGLFHTYEATTSLPSCVLSPPLPCLADTSGDKVQDTPPDLADYFAMTNAYLTFCPTYRTTLLNNPMAKHYTNNALPVSVSISTMYFTCNQQARMQSYVPLRQNVFNSAVPTINSGNFTINGVPTNSIDYASQVLGAPVTITMTGSNFPVSANVEVTLGRIMSTDSIGTAFLPEAISAPTVTTGTTGSTSISATFNPVSSAYGALPPGLHTVCVRTYDAANPNSDQTIAYLDNAIEVTPWIDVWNVGSTPPTEAYNVVFKAAQPIYGWIGFEIPALTTSFPIGMPGGTPVLAGSYDLLLNLANTQLQMFNLPSTTFAGLAFDSSPSTPSNPTALSLLNGMRVFMQYAQFDPINPNNIHLSNEIEFVVP